MNGVRDAALQALLGQSSALGLLVLLAASVGWGTWKEVRARRAQRKGLSYNVLFNSPLGPPETGRLIELRDRESGAAIAEPSMAVIRITNVGSRDIAEADYQLPVRVHFGRRKVQLVDVTDGHPTDIEQVFVPTVDGDGTGVVLPPAHFNAGYRFKLLVLLSGHHDDGTVRVGGLLRGGEIVDARAQDKKNRIWRWRIGTAGVASLAAGALTMVILAQSADLRPPRPGDPTCVRGTGQVVGSSAFASAALQAIGSYNRFCADAGAHLGSDFVDSADGIRRVSMPESPDVALHDGPALLDDQQRRDLVGQPVAIVPYSLVVNAGVRGSATGPVDLSLAQVRDIFAGRIRTWRDIDARYSAAEIILVGRNSRSGSRRVFEQYVLGDGSTPGRQRGLNAPGCRPPGPGVPPPYLCETDTTGDLLDRVAGVPGAIGYADTPQARKAGDDVIEVRIDGVSPSPEQLDRYPFWTVEYAYHRSPPAGTSSLAAEFVRHLTSAVPADSDTTPARLLEQEGYPPCGDHRFRDLCARRA
ncbi:phosphate transport system substrate-binding protein [Micromonospora pallida]|uniref:Phosphate transport system substrate-binding protein n=1 Tax=Micromonospora pallida TaxID=145854 RepID=A0A1C6TIN8_9ACTN|nr:substrate-binding domain-containing protein [Micromonospora pallida]SCL41433.1 phosphate transport system substrate-binding protein [Micromonospora pallida]